MADAEHPLIQRANAILYSESGFYSAYNEAAFSEEFVFRGPVPPRAASLAPYTHPHRTRTLHPPHTRTRTRSLRSPAPSAHPLPLARCECWSAPQRLHPNTPYTAPTPSHPLLPPPPTPSQYIGPLNKRDYLETMDTFKIYQAIPDI